MVIVLASDSEGSGNTKFTGDIADDTANIGRR